MSDDKHKRQLAKAVAYVQRRQAENKLNTSYIINMAAWRHNVEAIDIQLEIRRLSGGYK